MVQVSGDADQGGQLLLHLLGFIARELGISSVRLYDLAAGSGPVVFIGEPADLGLDEARWPYHLGLGHTAQTLSGRAVPIFAADGAQIGALEAVAPDGAPPAWGKVRPLLSALGLALAQFRHQKAQTETARRLALLLELTEAAAQAADFNAALKRFLAILCQALHADFAQAWTVQLEENTLLASYGTDHASRRGAKRFPDAVRRALRVADHRRFGTGMMHGTAIIVSALDQLDIAPGTYLSMAADHGFQSIVSIPVDKGGTTLAMTFLFFERVQDTPQLRNMARDLSAKVQELIDRKLTEERLSLFTSVIENASDAVLVTEGEPPPTLRPGDFAARIEYVNPAFCEMTGYSREELIGRPADLLHGPETSRETVERAIAARRRCEKVRTEIVHYRKDGTPYWSDVTIAPVVRDGRSVRFISIHRDITERRAAEVALRERKEELRRVTAEQRAIIDALPAYIGLLDQHGVVRMLNQGWRDFSEEAGYADVVRPGINYLELCERLAGDGNEYAATAVKGLRDLFDGKTEQTSFDYPSDSVAGKKWFRCIMVRLPEERAGLVVMYVDITAQRAAIEETELARAKAEASDRAKSEFLANMSHELRTPLNAILGMAECIRDQMFGEIGSPQYQQYARDIFDSGAHLLEIINDVLDLSKIEADAISLAEDWIDPRLLLNKAIRMVKTRSSRTTIDVLVDDPTGRLEVLVDDRRLTQILINLLANSIKFSPSDAPIRVEISNGAANGLQIAVVDSGIGMSEAEVAIALQPFRQVDGGLSRRFEGSGLGLPLARRFAEKNGIGFEIVSRKGAGTTVTLSWPPERVRSARERLRSFRT